MGYCRDSIGHQVSEVYTSGTWWAIVETIGHQISEVHTSGTWWAVETIGHRVSEVHTSGTWWAIVETIGHQVSEVVQPQGPGCPFDNRTAKSVRLYNLTDLAVLLTIGQPTPQ